MRTRFPPGTVLLSTTVHELGHAIGLDDMKWGRVQIMGYFTNPAISSPTQYDRDGVRALP